MGLRLCDPRTPGSHLARSAARREALGMLNAAPSAPTATAADWHRRQRDLVAASLVACPRSGRPTHRRWA
jgi:hypothetical protein